MIVPIWSGPFSIKRNTFLWKIGTKCSFRAKKNVLFRIFNIERNFLFLNEWLRNNGIVPLLSFWSFLFTKGTIVPINAIPFRVALPFMLARGTLVPNYLRSFSCKGTFVPFYHCSCFATPLLALCIVQRLVVIRMRVAPVRPLHVFARCSFYQ